MDMFGSLVESAQDYRKYHALLLGSFVYAIQKSNDSKPNMALLKRSLNFHQWLDGAVSKHHSFIRIPRHFIFSKIHNAGSTLVHAIMGCSEWSNLLFEEEMFSLPPSRPKWDANRSVSLGGRHQIRGPYPRSRRRCSIKQSERFSQAMENNMIFPLSSKGIRGENYLKRCVSGKSFRPKIIRSGGRYLTHMLALGFRPLLNFFLLRMMSL